MISLRRAYYVRRLRQLKTQQQFAYRDSGLSESWHEYIANQISDVELKLTSLGATQHDIDSVVNYETVPYWTYGGVLLGMAGVMVAAILALL